MADWIKGGVAVFVLVVAQLSMTPQLTDAPGGPDLLLVLVVALALLRGAEAAALAGFAGGLLLDAALFEPVGVTSLVLVLVALCAARAAARLDRAGVVLALLLVLAAAPLAQLGHALIAASVGAGHPLSYVLRSAVLPTTVQTAVLALPLLVTLYRLFGSTRPRPDVSPVVPA